MRNKEDNTKLQDNAINIIKDIINKGRYEEITLEEKINLNYMLEELFGKEIDNIMNGFPDEKVLDGEANSGLKEISNIINSYLDFKKFNIEHASFTRKLEEILNGEYDGIVVFKANFGWNIELKQRPQHIAEQLAKKNILYLYISSDTQDSTYSIENISENLYLINMYRYTLKVSFFELIQKINKPKFLHVYATCLYAIRYSGIKEYMDNGFKILYDFVDEISEELAKANISKEVMEEHHMLLQDYENVITLSTADNLYRNVLEIRGNKNNILCPNGVNISDFKKESYDIPENMSDIVEQGKPIIGYYGALASWLDYEAIKYIASHRPEYEIVLIGWKYDESYKESGVETYSNIHYLGIVDYYNLANYSKYFNVSIIPFLLNDITKATSPVKLFEYMAVGNPIITTDLKECRKYESTLIVKDKEEFLEKIDYCINILSKDKKYKALLAKEAEENTWEKRAKDIKDAMMKI